MLQKLRFSEEECEENSKLNDIHGEKDWKTKKF